VKQPHPKHLIGSKWTDLAPRERDKHFVVTRLGSKSTAPDHAQGVELRAVISNRARQVSLADLLSGDRWKPGWN